MRLKLKDLQEQKATEALNTAKNFRFKATESLLSQMNSQISSESQVKVTSQATSQAASKAGSIGHEEGDPDVFMQSWARFFIYEPKEPLTTLTFF
jgi:hypothetical protein